jgi:DNA topoisomerase-1
VQLLENHLKYLVDYDFTAQMEDDLDSISRGEAEHVEYLHRFYYGNGAHGLKQQLAHKVDEIDARSVSQIAIGQPDGGQEVFVRVGRYGPFIQQGERRAAVPEDLPPDELTLPKALELLARAQQAEEPLGICPSTGKPVYAKVGRFGPYVQRGTPDDAEKPQSASLLKGMNLQEIDLPTALRLLELPRNLGEHPASGDAVMAANGRFGPYIKCGAETRSLPAELSPLDVTLAQALELLAQPKTRGRRTARREPLRVFGPSPVTEQSVHLLEGRYGPYLTDGVTNASLPKGVTPEEITLEQALELLAHRAAQPSARKKSSTRKPAAKSRAAPTKGVLAASTPPATGRARRSAAPKKSGKRDRRALAP